MKLRSGQYIYGDGETVAEAARDAGTTATQVLRFMPVKAFVTEEEKEATRRRIAEMKRRLDTAE